jgi:CO dehydrogenase/acetyl-CoA synthase gamma subunit (corrinoid Fe-S protein)
MASSEITKQAKRYVDSVIEIDRRSGRGSSVSPELYERAVKKVARATQSMAAAAQRASQKR